MLSNKNILKLFNNVLTVNSILPSFITISNNIKLGRWNHNITQEQLERRIDLANADNCYSSLKFDKCKFIIVNQ